MRAAGQGYSTDLRGHKDLIAPHHRRRRPESAKRDAPGDVLALAPSGGEIGFSRDAEPGRSAPLRPIGNHWRSGEHNRDRDKSCSHGVAYSATENGETVAAGLPPNDGVRHAPRH